MGTSKFPDLPIIRWEVFAKRTRIRWPHGCMPVSYCCEGEALEGTGGYWIKLEEEEMKPAKKPAKKVDMKPMKDKQKDKGKGTKKDCK